MNGNINLSSKDKTDKNTMIEDVENGVDELPDPYVAKAAARVFDKIYNGNYGVLP